MNPPLYFLSAGDPSGDTAASRLLDALRVHSPQLAVCGLGGAKLAERGQEQFAGGNDLAVMGFWEVAKRFSFFRSLLDRCVREIETRKPRAIILVDYPGFNLRLAERVKKIGIPIIYYISPQVWAWGKKRIEKMQRLIDLLLLILPFEKEFFASTGIRTEFVGHYLLEDIPAQMISSTVPENGRLALLPGSREVEIRRILPVLLETGKQWHAQTGQRAIVAGIHGRFAYDAQVARYRSAGVEIEYDNTRDVVCRSSAVVVASGTATLECGLIGRPMVIVYKTGEITWQIAKRLVDLPSIGLVNLTLGSKVAPELLQHEATPDRIMQELSAFTTDSKRRSEAISQFHHLPGLLGGAGASDRAAKLIHEMVA